MPVIEGAKRPRHGGGRHLTRKTSPNSTGERIKEILQAAGGLQGPVWESCKGPGAETVNPDAAGGGTKARELFRILIADDHPVVREGLSALINRQTDMCVVSEASNGREAVEQFFIHHPDLALLDLRMPLMDGIEAVLAICEKEPGARLVILTNYESEEEIYRALRAGAQGYLLKDVPVPELSECIRTVANGRMWIPSGVGSKLARRVAVQELTARETEVLGAIVAGKSNKEIGVLLDITESTVKVHVTHVLEKLHASGRTEAINFALKRGLVRPDLGTDTRHAG